MDETFTVVVDEQVPIEEQITMQTTDTNLTELFNNFQTDVTGILNKRLDKITENVTKIENDIKKLRDNLTAKFLENDESLTNIEKLIDENTTAIKSTLESTNKIDSIVKNLKTNQQSNNANNSMIFQTRHIKKNFNNFSGKGSYHVIDFISDLKNYNNIFQIPENLKIDIALDKFEGPAKEWSKTISKETLNFDQFCEIMLNKYWGVEKQLVFQQSLFYGKYEGDNGEEMEDYLSECF